MEAESQTVAVHLFEETNINEELAAEIIDQIATLAGGGNLPPFVSVSKLPVGKIFTVKKVIKRHSGVNGAPFTGIQLYLDDDYRTNLPKRLDDFLFTNKDAFEVFARSTLLFRFDGMKRTVTGNTMALVSFPKVVRPNGCICSENYMWCTCSLFPDPRFPCLCYGKLEVNDVQKFRSVVSGIVGKNLSSFMATLNLGSGVLETVEDADVIKK